MVEAPTLRPCTLRHRRIKVTRVTLDLELTCHFITKMLNWLAVRGLIRPLANFPFFLLIKLLWNLCCMVKIIVHLMGIARWDVKRRTSCLLTLGYIVVAYLCPQVQIEVEFSCGWGPRLCCMKTVGCHGSTWLLFASSHSKLSFIRQCPPSSVPSVLRPAEAIKGESTEVAVCICRLFWWNRRHLSHGGCLLRL